MENKKIKILFVPSDLAGVGHFRCIWPAQQMNKDFDGEFDIEITHQPNYDDFEYFAKFDIIHFHRELGSFENMPNFFKKLKERGVKLIVDIDDYWMPPTTHPLYYMITKHKVDERILGFIKNSDYVTTTTNIFAKEISKHNKNVFVVPNALDENHQMWNGTDTKQTEKVRISWIGGSCYDNKTEILTENGFKFFKDLDKNEKVACLNPKTNDLEFNYPINYIKEKYDGKLQCGVNNIIDYAVTPNHNMYVSNCESLTKKELNFKLQKSEDVFGKNIYFKKGCNWNGKEEKYIIIPKFYEPNLSHDIKINENYLEKNKNLNFENILIKNNFEEEDGVLVKKEIRKSKKNNFFIQTTKIKKFKENYVLDMDEWLKFFGFWIAEGWISETEGLYQVGVAQIKDNNYLEEIFKTLKNLGFNPKYTKDKTQIRIFDKQLWYYLKQFGKSHEKFIPKYILNLSKRQLKILLDWYLKGDGSLETKSSFFDKRIDKKTKKQRGFVVNNSNRQRAYTVSKRLADNIQEICLKLDLNSNITNRGKRNSKMKDGRILNAKFDSYVISIGSDGVRKKTNPLLKKENQFEIEYNDFVYCVEVPHNIIFVRRNGKTMWCGNSHMRDLELIRDDMNRLNSDVDLKGKYQIILCGFDTRGTVTQVAPDGREHTRKILPHETIWNKFEEVFTTNYSICDDEYKKYLGKYTKDSYKNTPVSDLNYLRRWTLPLTQYGKHYDYCDICLAPLEENKFNEVKSELKVIESGFKKKVLIAQDFGAYSETVENGKNGILIPTKDNNKGWYKAMKKLILDKEYRDELSTNLNKFVLENYTLKIVTQKRVEFYHSILEKKSNEILEEYLEK